MNRETWVILRGGPKDGLVVDTVAPAVQFPEVFDGFSRIRYEPTAAFEAHPDGGTVRVYRFVGTADNHPEAPR